MAPRTSLFLAVPGSDLGERVAAAAAGPTTVLTLDAAFAGEELLLASEPVAGDAGCATRLTWAGVPVVADGRPLVSRVLVERPVFAWPQPWCDEVPALDGEAFPAEAERLHAARSATIAALRVLADLVPVANPPALALLAATPAIALARLARAGVDVHPWSLGVGSAAADDHAGARSALLGRERWCEPGSDARGALRHAPFEGEALRLLVVADAVLAADGAAPHGHEHARRAREAARALGLPLAAVELVPTNGAVLRVDAAPDLDAWDGATSGAVAASLCNWLAGAPVAGAAPVR